MSVPTELETLWLARYCPPDNREIWEWITDEGELPSAYAMPGKFDIETAPFTKEIFRALKSKIVRTVTAMASVQSLKTLIGELWLVWLIANDPGPTQWVLPDDQEAAEHTSERFTALIDSFRCLQLFHDGNRHHQTDTYRRFVHMWWRAEGAVSQGNRQRKSVKNQMCSEVWQSDKWTPGVLKEFATRLTQFTHNSKRYIEGQPGYAAHLKIDDMDPKYQEGSQEQLNTACLSCGHVQPILWSVVRPDGTRAGMRWESSPRTKRDTKSTDPNEIYRWGELYQTVRFECFKCGHAHFDEPLTRRRLLSNWSFVSQNLNAPADNRSFNWSQLLLPNLSWHHHEGGGGVKNWILAVNEARRGNEKPQQDFVTKVLAEPYDPEKFAHTDQLWTVELKSEAKGVVITHEGIEFPHLFAGVDVQATSYWMLIMAFSANGDEFVLWCGELYTWQEVADKQAEYGVSDERVSVDISHRREEVIYQCATHGHLDEKKHWLAWWALQGSDQNNFSHLDQNKKRTHLPFSWPPEVGDPSIGLKRDDPRLPALKGKRCGIIRWSNSWIKDVALARRDNRARGIKCFVARGEWNKIYSHHLYSQKKAYISGKFGAGKWKWARFHDDHLLDCLCMCYVHAFRKKVIGLESPEVVAVEHERGA